jgi:hypothetical protein
LAHAFLWEYSYKRLKLAQLPGQLGVFLTLSAGDSARMRAAGSARRVVAAAEKRKTARQPGRGPWVESLRRRLVYFISDSPYKIYRMV